ncbi:MAG: C_GCAxxG_C_C family protein [Candidatus Aminicenantes bacterium]|nr:MAG: C_GCAxxG_C_C family protein [Candidatus Aminicenantes bacterium]
MKNERIQTAVERFKQGFSCSQAVLSAFSDAFGLDMNLALKISQPFGGGIAHRGEICGAVSGALMVIGLKLGRTQAEDTPARERTYESVVHFIREFENLHGSIICKDLLGYDLGSEEEYKKVEKEGLFETLCPKFVQNAADILTDMI